jgi:hypothetical protein
LLLHAPDLVLAAGMVGPIALVPVLVDCAYALLAEVSNRLSQCVNQIDGLSSMFF